MSFHRAKRAIFLRASVFLGEIYRAPFLSDEASGDYRCAPSVEPLSSSSFRVCGGRIPETCSDKGTQQFLAKMFLAGWAPCPHVVGVPVMLHNSTRDVSML